MANHRPKVIAEFINDYEERTIVHRDERGRIRIRRNQEVVALRMSKEISKIVGARIRAERKQQGMQLAVLARRAGLTPTKQRMREIEQGSRSGMRIGTIYALAWALGVNPLDLLPNMEEVMKQSAVLPVDAGEVLSAVATA